MIPPRVFCCKSAQVVEGTEDDVFFLAKERAKRAKERGVWEVWRRWVLKVTVKYRIYGE